MSAGRVFLHFYHGLVQSKLDYGSIIYISALVLSQTFDHINHWPCICLRTFRTTPTQSLYTDAGEPPFSRRHLKHAILCLSLKAYPGNPAYHAVFHLRNAASRVQLHTVHVALLCANKDIVSIWAPGHAGILHLLYYLFFLCWLLLLRMMLLYHLGVLFPNL